MRRIKIVVAYDGTDFHGWQVQPGLPTIQGALEKIVGDIEGKPVHVAGSGRTDAGVHALAQVAAFSLENPIPEYNLRKAINRLLPPAFGCGRSRRPIRIFTPALTPSPKRTSTGFTAERSSRPSSGAMPIIILIR